MGKKKSESVRYEYGGIGIGSRTWLCLALAFFLAMTAVRAEVRTITVFEGRQISVSYPKDWRFEVARDPNTGVWTINIADQKSDIMLDVSFFPDREGRLAKREGMDREMKKIFKPYLSGAVESVMVFTSFDAPGGIGGYTTFTDRSLVGRKIPEGERLMSTTGMRSWKGVSFMFTLLSNSLDTDEYKLGLEIVKTGIREIDKSGKQEIPREESETSGPTGFTVRGAPWILTLPSEVGEVQQQKLSPDGNSGYFHLSNEKTGINVSFFIEPALKCKSSRNAGIW